jgi:hypothetical protein
MMWLASSCFCVCGVVVWCPYRAMTCTLVCFERCHVNSRSRPSESVYFGVVPRLRFGVHARTPVLLFVFVCFCVASVLYPSLSHCRCALLRALGVWCVSVRMISCGSCLGVMILWMVGGSGLSFLSLWSRMVA